MFDPHDLKPLERLFWVDIETTGLDPEEEALMEVAFAVTDTRLRIVDTWERVISVDPHFLEARLKKNDYVRDMHERSGLATLVLQEDVAVSVKDASDDLCAWLDCYEMDQGDPLCGSSVGFDRGWLDLWMPEVTRRFGYRNIDVSSLKELMMRWSPEIYTELHGKVLNRKNHRGAPDLEDSIQELKFYRNEFLWVPTDFSERLK